MRGIKRKLWVDRPVRCPAIGSRAWSETIEKVREESICIPKRVELSYVQF